MNSTCDYFGSHGSARWREVYQHLMPMIDATDWTPREVVEVDPP